MSSGNSRIFYKTLLVVDLDKIIKGAGKQKTSTIHLNLFPTEANEISSIFMGFTDNVHKQMGFIGKDIPTFESLEASGAEITSLTFTASGIGLTLDEIPEFLSTHDFLSVCKGQRLGCGCPYRQGHKCDYIKACGRRSADKRSMFLFRLSSGV